MSRKLRLGPVAIFLTVVAIVLATLAVLTQATSHADLVLAQRFANVTEIRYALEEEGQRYLMEVDEAVEAGDFSAESVGAETLDSGNISRVIEKDGYTLTIEITKPARGKYEIKEWKISREWTEEDPFDNIWQGTAKP